jgi:steroid 5-alpha reductase family enzyme
MKADTKRGFIGTTITVLIATGLAFAGSQHGYNTASGIPIFALCVFIAFILQWIAFIPSYIKRTEKFYDLSGGITFLIVIATAILLTPVRDVRSWLLAGITSIWAVRLSSFLFLRIRTAGEDRRFREIKQSFWRFLLAWTLQGLWVAFSLSSALAVITSTKRVELGIFAIVGFLVWIFGFAIEIIADRQKSAFNENSENKGKFINTGLWAWSRHPNYFGEITLWVGVMIIALPNLQGWQWVTLISPIFITLLLTRISGLPMLEARADEKWGGQEDYESYKANTPVLIPKPPSK